uniref:Amidase domain-containing protein n=1 Tax=Globodera pallida TaxID=36090 RepID=A0A183BMT9_GLOPA
MLRYKLIQSLYPLLTLIALLYYALLNRVFSLISRFLPKGKVTWSDEEAKEPLLFMSAKKAAEKIQRKELSSTQLVSLYIARLQRVQPLVNAVVMDNFEAARAEAEAVDLYMATLDEKSEEFQMLSSTKPLLGVPFTFKNNMDVKGFVTVAGCNKFLNNAPAEKDSKVMERLRSAGAIPVAITNLPKLAMNWCAENEVFGRTVNPYDVRRIPGGSSGGDSAAVSAGAALFGIGNDLAGSPDIRWTPLKSDFKLKTRTFRYIETLFTVSRASFETKGLRLYTEDPNALHLQFVAGAVAGATQGFISSPMELLKLRAQICHEPTSSAAPKRSSSSPLSMARQIWREKGLRHFSRGLLITQLRDCPAMGVYFASYAFLRRKTDAGSGEQQRLSNLQLLCAGGAAGMCSWLCNYPADVVKTRFQADDAYSNYREVIRKAYAENGWRTFFAGLGPTLIRAIPTNAAIFFTVEWTYRILLKARTIDQKDKASTNLDQNVCRDHGPPTVAKLRTSAAGYLFPMEAGCTLQEPMII